MMFWIFDNAVEAKSKLQISTLLHLTAIQQEEEALARAQE